MSWFECKITYDKEISAEGKLKKVSESYLLDAETFTDAEARMTELMESRGAFTMDTVKKVRLSELFLDDKSERFYKAKVGFISLDEKAGVEKKKYVQMLVQADNFREALDNLNKGMKDTLADYEIAQLQETTIMDVFPYEVK
ncbi:MAG: DUF4494 domain-containing protein [Porphyromonas sp.]|nr:DUF4494 domain-containing protein [Bacteroidales bacterium]MDY3101452.1 DUF4494 domain-containing protein [Porphyromonas sp.]